MSTVIHAVVDGQEGTAVLWFRNGDHPEDGPADQEGKVVRYFRHPCINGETVCDYCGHKMHDHGFVEQGVHTRVWNSNDALSCSVCPGDWVTQLNGSLAFIVCDQSNFTITPYHIESMKNKIYASNFKMRKVLELLFEKVKENKYAKRMLNELLTNPFIEHQIKVALDSDGLKVHFNIYKNDSDPFSTSDEFALYVDTSS